MPVLSVLSLANQNCMFCPYSIDKDCQFYLHCQRSNLPGFSLVLRWKKNRFIILVPDKKCGSKLPVYLHCHRSKLPVLSLLSQIKIASFILVVKDQGCQFYLHYQRSKLSNFSLLLRLKKSLIILFPNKKRQSYYYSNCPL